ncbi:hypothetical protein CHLRE_07g356650v5 [Chlamydomonas reinhardtii]|uniref:Uncharacterized protein n=1 Tax=Chlamydomonas reinhardtii TaxID=3055 RepID=A0A2K3DLR0_CHLRE|nr:uncharacterized protein CHLRE_07g356650v5 [Chlamydomonas reinhardtii]PNW81451.1 hypothetical protein CHLRE_07g356650v5 [Chlamydomonas reinhardtii]
MPRQRAGAGAPAAAAGGQRRRGRGRWAAAALVLLAAVAVAAASAALEDELQAPGAGQGRAAAAAAAGPAVGLWRGLARLPRRLLSPSAAITAALWRLCPSSVVRCSNTIQYDGRFATQKVVIAEPEAAAPAAEAAATPAAATGGTAPISTATGGELGAFYDYEYGGALAGGAGPVSGAALGPTSTQAPFGGASNLPTSGGLGGGTQTVVPETTTQGVFGGGGNVGRGVGGSAVPTGTSG